MTTREFMLAYGYYSLRRCFAVTLPPALSLHGNSALGDRNLYKDKLAITATGGDVYSLQGR